MQKYPKNYWRIDEDCIILAIGKDINKTVKEQVVDDHKWYKATLKRNRFSSRWAFLREMLRIVWCTSYSRRLLANRLHMD